MGKTAKIAISLPEEILEAAERERLLRGESRSEFFRRAVETYLRQECEHEAVQRYVQSYREQPESDEEVLAAQRAAAVVLAQEPWE